MLFGEENAKVPFYEDAIAVRPDWNTLTQALDEALEFLQKGGSVSRIAEQKIPKKETAAAVQVL